jgi:hypothetical protein
VKSWPFSIGSRCNLEFFLTKKTTNKADTTTTLLVSVEKSGLGFCCLISAYCVMQKKNNESAISYEIFRDDMHATSKNAYLFRVKTHNVLNHSPLAAMLHHKELHF